MLQPHLETLKRHKRPALPSHLKLDKILKRISTMSSPSPSEAPTLPVPPLRIKNVSSEKVNKEHLPMDRQQSTLMQLPLKVRTIIWQYVLGGRKIEPRAIPFNTGKRIVPYVYKWRTTIRMEDDRWCDPWMPPPRCFACLLRTCRLVYGSLIIPTSYAN